MADLELVAVRILEENRVIAGAVLSAKLRSFDVFRAGLSSDFGNFVDGIAAFGPERDPVSIRLVMGFLNKSEKIDGDAALGLKQTPFLAALVHAKYDSRQNLRVKALGVFTIFYPKIDVIEKTRAHAVILHAHGLIV